MPVQQLQALRRARDSNLYRIRRELVDNYVESFRPRHRRRSGAQPGTNKPPTADDLRQIKEDSNAWYPSDRRVEEYRRNLKARGEERGLSDERTKLSVRESLSMGRLRSFAGL